MTGGSKTVNAVETTCRLLSILEERGGAGVTELADELGIAKSAVHSHLSTLRQANFVVKDGTTYRLSLRFLSMAEHVKDQLGIYDVVSSEIRDLADETGEVAQFAVEEEGRLVYVERIDGEKAVDIRSDVGHRGMFHCTGLGKAILASLPRERSEGIVDDQGLDENTANTITDRGELFEHLDGVRERGYAVDDEEAIDGLRCVAAPVVASERTVGAVSVSGPARRMEDARIRDELAPLVLRAANVIELNATISDS